MRSTPWWHSWWSEARWCTLDVLFPTGHGLPTIEATLEASVEPEGDGYVVRLRGDRLLQAVTGESRGWVADDDSFHLVGEKVLRFRAMEGARGFKVRFTALNMEGALTVRG